MRSKGEEIETDIPQMFFLRFSFKISFIFVSIRRLLHLYPSTRIDSKKKKSMFLLLDKNSKIKGKSSGNPLGITSKIMKNWPQMFDEAEGLKEIGEFVTVTT